MASSISLPVGSWLTNRMEACFLGAEKIGVRLDAREEGGLLVLIFICNSYLNQIN
jgi:hypothetical protein